MVENDDEDEEDIVEKPHFKRGRFELQGVENIENIENIEPSQAQVVEKVVTPVKSKRGRKPGSKNKPKVTTTTTSDPPVPRRGRPSKAEKRKLLLKKTKYD